MSEVQEVRSQSWQMVWLILTTFQQRQI